jgi:hypothetical protein
MINGVDMDSELIGHNRVIKMDLSVRRLREHWESTQTKFAKTVS